MERATDHLQLYSRESAPFWCNVDGNLYDTMTMVRRKEQMPDVNETDARCYRR